MRQYTIVPILFHDMVRLKLMKELDRPQCTGIPNCIAPRKFLTFFIWKYFFGMLKTFRVIAHWFDFVWKHMLELYFGIIQPPVKYGIRDDMFAVVFV